MSELYILFFVLITFVVVVVWAGKSLIPAIRYVIGNLWLDFLHWRYPKPLYRSKIEQIDIKYYTREGDGEEREVDKETYDKFPIT